MPHYNNKNIVSKINADRYLRVRESKSLILMITSAILMIRIGVKSIQNKSIVKMYILQIII